MEPTPFIDRFDIDRNNQKHKLFMSLGDFWVMLKG